MHQIYSCSDENIEVFTTVIPSKDAREPEADTEWALARQLCIEGSEGASGRLQCYGILELLMNEPHGVVIESDLYPPRPLELLPQRCERRDTGDRSRFGRLQTARPPGTHSTKTPVRPVGISEPKASSLCGNRAYGKSLISPVPRISVKAPAVVEVTAKGSENGAVLGRG
ncbi:Uncharacterized protein C8orf46-like [Cricetulus griseus]|uniref:Vexin n=1 Tax=Cricetulus griseus TaxID=10029 RepID=G3I8G9_CRIGR|nr:Uncharacterized protein C8orf46-like [Cricetulus griseus]